jgi:hypothetical protein
MKARELVRARLPRFSRAASRRAWCRSTRLGPGPGPVGESTGRWGPDRVFLLTGSSCTRGRRASHGWYLMDQVERSQKLYRRSDCTGGRAEVIGIRDHQEAGEHSRGLSIPLEVVRDSLWILSGSYSSFRPVVTVVTA